MRGAVKICWAYLDAACEAEETWTLATPDEIAQKMRVSARTAKRYFAKLEKAGFLTSIKLPDGRIKRCLWTVGNEATQ